MSQVFNILSKDASCRSVGISDDLFTLHELSETSTWNYELPTLITSNSEYIRKRFIRNNDKFRDKFYEQFREFYTVDLSNLLFAGGCVRSLLLDTNVNDIDIFVHGINDVAQAEARIMKFIIDIRNRLHKLKEGDYKFPGSSNTYAMVLETLLSNADKNRRYEIEQDFLSKHRLWYNPLVNCNIRILSNGKTITLLVGNKIQIILRLYNTISEILHGFDLGSSAVGFDGKNVYFTTLSKFCYENMVNIFDGSRRSTTYEVRLIKYFNDGFSIILPNLDIRKMRTQYHQYEICEICEMKYMVFSYSRINGNSIQVHKFFTHNGYEVTSDYDFYSGLDEDDDNDNNSPNYGLLYHNIKEMVKGTKRIVLSIDLERELDALSSQGKSHDNWKPDFGSKSLVEYKFLEWLYDSIEKKLNRYDRIDLNEIRNYINVMTLNNFIQEVYLTDMTRQEKTEKISSIINTQKRWFKSQLDTLDKKEFKLDWIIENPMTQLTSSVNPIIEDDAIWYGEYYITTADMIHRIDTEPVAIATNYNNDNISDNNETDSDESDY